MLIILHNSTTYSQFYSKNWFNSYKITITYSFILREYNTARLYSKFIANRYTKKY